MGQAFDQIGLHDQGSASTVRSVATQSSPPQITKFKYVFENFFHPLVGEFIARLRTEPSLAALFDPTWQSGLTQLFFDALYTPHKDQALSVSSFPKAIDVSDAGPYSNENWELFFHIPLTVAVHLSKTQRFAEAQKWFHYIFDPTSHDKDTTVPPALRFWKFLAFRSQDSSKTIDEVLRVLSIPETDLSGPDKSSQQDALNGYNGILRNPFHPHVVARTRPVAHQYCVVMKYLDNLIAWGDSLFQQDTIESVNEATQLYVLAANLLGNRPERVPPRGGAQAMNFDQLRKSGLGPIGDTFVDLESKFPFNAALPDSGSASEPGTGAAKALFGIGLALYFCLPPNQKLLSYWDTVADRLFKIRHCMNIEGIVRPLALFDPPIDPGMLVKAAAAGIDIGSIVNGLNQPIGPVRCLPQIQKALELCGEVRALGGALLSALEKGDGEHLALIRQRHEIQIQQMAQEVKFLQWKSAQESTKSLLTSRATALEKYSYYQRLLGLPPDPNAPDKLALDSRELTEENFDEAYAALVGQYDKQLSLQKFPALRLAGGASPAQQSGASGSGRLYLSVNEDAELNAHLPAARDFRIAVNVANAIATGLNPIPSAEAHLAFWGIGVHSRLLSGDVLAAAARIGGDILGIRASYEQDQAGMAGRTAGHERRADDWALQCNLAAHELMQIGRQILTSLIAEQIAHHEYLNVQQQIANAQEVNQFLRDKFSNEDLYLWMQGEISRLYYEYYRFAFDTARKAERTMKQELMRPELDAQDFVQFNYWDGGRKGLLAGEALHLDVKRMEMAYHDNNKRELELTRHVSLRQLDPLALLALKVTGSCQFTVPEWFYDRDCQGHYMRRIVSIALSTPCTVGPFTSVNCTLSLLRSTVRTSPIVGDDYLRQGTDDSRFLDYAGAVQSIVTSGANSDSGLFETNLRDDRFLPFEGAGAVSTWKLDLPKPQDYPAFDYGTISDVILHVRFRARQGVIPAKVKESLDNLFQADPSQNTANLALLFSLRYDFPTEWSAFANTTADFSARLRKDYFPYWAQNKIVTINAVELYASDVKHGKLNKRTIDPAALANLSDDLNGKDAYCNLTVAQDNVVLKRDPTISVFLILRYSLG